MDSETLAAAREKRRRIAPEESMNDPAARLPPETFSLILTYLNPPALSRCARVSRGKQSQHFVYAACTDSSHLSHSAWKAFCYNEGIWKDLLQRYDCLPPAQGTSNLIAVTGTLQMLEDCEPLAEQYDDLLRQSIDRYKNRNVTSHFDSCNTFRSLCCQLWKLDCNWNARAYADEHVACERVSASSSDKAPDEGGSDALSETARNRSLDFLQHTLELPSDGPGAWRLKLDPVERTIITTGQTGGVQVYDQATKKLLWHIPKTATRPNSHLEFSNGYFVFDRQGLGHFEVWRSERLVPDLGRPPDRGHYQRVYVLDAPRPVLAYRFQYPVLAMASQSGTVRLWNVPERKEIDLINITASIHGSGNITYIDFDDEFVFLTGMGAKSISVFSRQSKQLVWSMGQHFANGGLRPATFDITPVNATDSEASDESGEISASGPADTSTSCETEGAIGTYEEYFLSPKAPNEWQSGPNTMNMAQLTMRPWQIWSAVHPDIKTNTLLILGQGTVLLIRDYKQFFRDTSKSPQLFIEIELWNLKTFYNSFMPGHMMRQGYSSDEARASYDHDDWNRDIVWEQVPDAALAVHEGKAFVMNVRDSKLCPSSSTLTRQRLASPFARRMCRISSTSSSRGSPKLQCLLHCLECG